MQYQLNQSSRCTKTSNDKQQAPRNLWAKRMCTGLSIPLALMLSLSLLFIGKSIAAEHIIEMTAAETAFDDGLGNKLLAYRMDKHTVDGADITAQYSGEATIPGPTIVLTEGDTVKLTLFNSITGAHGDLSKEDLLIGHFSNQVSVHVHGVHYDIDSDGTLEVINKVNNEGAGYVHIDGDTPIYTYNWHVANGTAGTWAYHDHNLMTHNGAEQKGLFGTIIVNPVGSPAFAKEYVLYLTDDAFWGMEIDGVSRMQTKHGVNPTLAAEKNSDVRFHLIALGTDIHEFTLDGYRWIDPGTTKFINQVAIGPLENHVFTVKAKRSAQYTDENFSNKLMGMMGIFDVQ